MCSQTCISIVCAPSNGENRDFGIENLNYPAYSKSELTCLLTKSSIVTKKGTHSIMKVGDNAFGGICYHNAKPHSLSSLFPYVAETIKLMKRYLNI